MVIHIDDVLLLRTDVALVARRRVAVRESFLAYRRPEPPLVFVVDQVPVAAVAVPDSLAQHDPQHVRVDADTRHK